VWHTRAQCDHLQLCEVALHTEKQEQKKKKKKKKKKNKNKNTEESRLRYFDMWYQWISGTITTASLPRRFDHHVTGEDLVGAYVPPG